MLSVVIAAGLARCAAPALTGEPPDIHVANGTTLPVTIVVSGTVLGTVAAQGSADFPADDLPDLPWVVEARSPSGRVLTTMTVAQGQVRETHWPDGRSEFVGAMGRVDLSCGRLTIWAGNLTPSGPVPGPGVPGDCAP